MNSPDYLAALQPILTRSHKATFTFDLLFRIRLPLIVPQTRSLIYPYHLITFATMSYGGQPPYGGPPQGNQGYGGYPQNQGYGHAPPPGPPPQQQYGGYGPPQGPPPQHFGGGPQGNWGPPQGPPPGQFGGPPQHQQGGYGPPQGPPPGQQFGGPPQQQYNQYGAPPAQPSPGYVPGAAAQGDASRDADALRSAMKGFGTDEQVLIRILTKPDPLQMGLLRNTYNQRHRRDLEKDIKSETSKYFQETLVGLVQGPLMHDVHTLNGAIKGLGTKESMLNDVLLNRSNADLRAIKQAYHQTFRKTLESDVKGDLSAKTETLFDMVMSATRSEESAPVNPQELEHDCSELHRAMDGRVGTDQIAVCSILAKRSDGQLRAIAHHWQQKYHSSLEKVIESEFSGHMKDALLLIVQRAGDRAMSDAVQLEATMAGPGEFIPNSSRVSQTLRSSDRTDMFFEADTELGTKDTLLVQRVVRVHWNRAHMDQVKRAYAHRYKKDLIQRVKGEIHFNKGMFPEFAKFDMDGIC